MGLARSLISQSVAGDSDEEDASVMATFQELLGLANSLSQSSKAKLAEMISRSSLGQMRPLQMAGMMPGGYPPHHLQYPPQQRQVLPPAQPPKPQIQPLKDLCQYPLPGTVENVGSITVTLDDYKTLAASTFLNDTIIDFYMKHLQYNIFSEADRDRYGVTPSLYLTNSLYLLRVHIFTTYWFSRLIQTPSPIEARKDDLIRRHDKVKRWTRKVNIFEKDFVVVPINENYHWYLCIICYPGQVGEGCRTVEDGAPCPTPASQRNRRRAKNKIKVGGGGWM